MNTIFKTHQTNVREPYVQEFFFNAIPQSNMKYLDAAENCGSTYTAFTSAKYLAVPMSSNDWNLKAETLPPGTNPMMPLDMSFVQRMPNIHMQLVGAKVDQPLMHEQLCKNQRNSNISQLVTVSTPDNLQELVAQVEQPQQKQVFHIIPRMKKLESLGAMQKKAKCPELQNHEKDNKFSSERTKSVSSCLGAPLEDSSCASTYDLSYGCSNGPSSFAASCSPVTSSTEMPPVLHLFGHPVEVPFPDGMSCTISPRPDHTDDEKMLE